MNRPSPSTKRSDCKRCAIWGILDTAPEESYDAITRLAQQLFGVPIALVSLVDVNRQWFKSKQGLEASETGRDISFCGHAILNDEVLEIPDALADPRFADNPLVTGAPDIRFYAGAPLTLGDGSRVGTLCIIDRQQRRLSAAQTQCLRDLGKLAVSALENSKRHRAARQLAGHASYLNAVLDTIEEGIASVDEHGRIRSINRAAATMFGTSSDTAQQRQLSELIAPDDRESFDRCLRAALEQPNSPGSRKPRAQVRGLRADQSTFPVRAVCSPMGQDQSGLVVVLHDLSQREHDRQQLAAASRWRQAILDAAGVAIISTDTSGLIQTFNLAAQRMLGYDESEVVGIHTPALIHDPAEVVDRARLLSAELGREIAPGFEVFVARARSGQADEQEWTYLRKDQSRLTVNLAVSALTTETGEISGFLGVASDVSERRRIERMKSEFVATVSHELRTPLTSIRGALGVVLGKRAEDLPAKVRKLLENANRNAERLTLLINDILDLEKIEAGHLDFVMGRLDLVQLCSAAVAANESYASQHQVKLSLQASLDSAPVNGDENRLIQVLNNLISNAIKFSPAGETVSISISAARPRIWRLVVSDQGRGIPTEFQERIFQRFAQADASDRREKGGTGLGLSIAKAIVERHAGEIGFTTELGVGSSFWFELPAENYLCRDQDNSGLPRVLICEDNPDVAAVIAELVRQHGIAADTVGSISAAVAALAAWPYVALLLDLKLPDGNGLDFVRELRGKDHFAKLPVLIISGSKGAGDPQMGDAIAVVDWLQKPVDKARLANALDEVMARTQRPRILHVEDEVDIIQITQALVDSAADYDYALTLAEARRKLTTHAYDLAIIDFNMPDGSGSSLIEQLPSGCQVLIFTGREVGEEIGKQVAAVLTKGETSHERLTTTIDRLLAKRVHP